MYSSLRSLRTGLVFAILPFVVSPCLAFSSDNAGSEVRASSMDRLGSSLDPRLAPVGSNRYFRFVDATGEGELSDVAVSGTTLYAGFSDVLLVFDINDPALPRAVGELQLPGHVTGIAVSHNAAYVSTDVGGLRVVDVSAPSRPVEIADVATTDVSYDVTVSYPYVYLADGTGGVRIFDVTTPAAPLEVGGYPAGESVRMAVAIGGQAYVADNTAGLVILDVSNPASPTAIGSYDTPGEALSLAWYGIYVLVADGTAGLRIVDISTPAAPVEVASFPAGDTTIDVAAGAGSAYFTDGSSVRVIDITTPSVPFELGERDVGSPILDVDLYGKVFVAHGATGFSILEVAPTSNILTGAGSLSFPGDVYDVAVSGTLACVAADAAGLRIVDVSDPTAPTEVGFFDTPGNARGVDVSGTYAFVADLSQGLKIIDVSNPSSPTAVSSYMTAGPAEDVRVSGHYAYVAAGNQGLYIIDIAVITNPVLAGQRRPVYGWTYGQDVDVSGDYVYFAYEMLDIIDASDPASLEVTEFHYPAYGVHAAGDYLYVATLGPWMYIVDVSSPMNPVYLTTWQKYYSPYATIRNIAVGGNIAYLAQSSAGLAALRVSVPQTPSLVDEYDTPGLAEDVTVQGDYVYVADRQGGLQIVERHAFVTIDEISSVAPTGIDASWTPVAMSLQQNYPNPFNPSTTIPVVLSERMHVNLSVYDVHGRLVTTLVNETLSEGAREIYWNGRDGDGNRVGSGVYFCRLAAGDEVLTRKMVFLK